MRGNEDTGIGREEAEHLRRALDRLERSRKRGRRLHVLWALVVTTLLVAGFAPHQGDLETEGVVVRDSAGRARIRLGLAGDVPSLSLYDPEGVLRAALAVDREGPILNLFAADGVPRLVLAERAARAFLVVRDAAGAPRAAMAVQENGEPSLYLLDADLKPVWRQPAQRGPQR